MRGEDSGCRIDRAFGYQTLKAGQLVMCEQLRNTAKLAAKMIDGMCADGREKTMALDKLEEAVFWAVAAIARGG